VRDFLIDAHDARKRHADDADVVLNGLLSSDAGQNLKRRALPSEDVVKRGDEFVLLAKDARRHVQFEARLDEVEKLFRGALVREGHHVFGLAALPLVCEVGASVEQA
jgi:hypothetical protein